MTNFEVEQSSWVRIPHLANFLSFEFFYSKAARMAERLRRATQVRVKQFSWVRIPLLASGSVLTLYK